MDSSTCNVVDDAFTCSIDLEGGGYQNSNLSSRRNLMLILLGICILVLVSVRLVLTKRKRNKRDSSFPRSMSLSEIEKATKGFHQDRIISVAATALVYQGAIPSYGQVAIKKFRGHSYDKYERELGACLAGFTHSNIIKLIGWCDKKHERILVYEFMSNGSLHKILHNSSEILTWERRLNIILGVASALVYLHHGCVYPIIHGDVKTDSIMIDSEFNAKLSHFGHAKFRNYGKPGITDGTAIGVPTVKSDVYNFGVVLLELATGRRRVEDDNTEVTDWVWELWGDGYLIRAADRRLGGKLYGYGGIYRVLNVGLWCVHPNPKERPHVWEAVEMILGARTIPFLPPRKPRFQIVYN